MVLYCLYIQRHTIIPDPVTEREECMTNVRGVYDRSVDHMANQDGPAHSLMGWCMGQVIVGCVVFFFFGDGATTETTFVCVESCACFAEKMATVGLTSTSTALGMDRPVKGLDTLGTLSIKRISLGNRIVK